MKKFKDAFNGLKLGLNHKAVLIQFVLALMAIIGGIIIKLDEHEWLSFVICIGLVIALELANTAIEYLCNFVEPNKSEQIKTIKDISSAAVLIASISAFCVMLICVFRRIL